MELRDLIVTPFVILLTYVLAYLVRPYFTDSTTSRYFFPALTLKVVGAIALGFIYQFYYHGGDTYNFHTLGSRPMWEAFMDSPGNAMDMFFSGGHHQGNFYRYSSRIAFFSDAPSFFIIRLAFIFDLFTFSSYAATAVCFSVIGFFGGWLLFLTFYWKYPRLHLWLAIGALFIPSVIFWGSGLLKDTVTLACLGVATFEWDRLFLRKKISIGHILILLLSFWAIFSLKKFILQAFIPAALIWIYLARMNELRSVVLRIVLFPIVVMLGGLITWFAVVKIGEGDSRYAVEKITETARVTAMDIGFQTGRDAGSGYSLGTLDGTLTGTLKLFPQAVNATLFRPYPWEVKNVLMLVSSIESICFLLLTGYVLVKTRSGFLSALGDPIVAFCMIFSIMYAFAVGVSTFNFGTLARYKIPLLPFYFIGMVIILYSNKDRKVEVLEETE